MNKTKLKEKIRTLVPDIRFVRKSIAKMRYRSISKRFIDENEIRAAEENSELKKDFVKKYTENEVQQAACAGKHKWRRHAA
ncbi:MAG: hypothetical protein II729_00415 [Ruminococcus sp.]|nr:hypothetical protein [Ruminococcus sp.]